MAAWRVYVFVPLFLFIFYRIYYTAINKFQTNTALRLQSSLSEYLYRYVIK